MLSVEALCVRYGKGQPLAVDGVGFTLEKGQTLGLAGASGSGKSSVAKAVMGLVRPCGGKVFWDGTDLAPLRTHARRPYLRDIQMVFQDVAGSLNPQKRVRELIAEPLRNTSRLSAKEETRRVVELLEVTGLGPEFTYRYPHSLSGGQRQRVVIARALALRPRLLILDEPVSALDVTVQTQVLSHLHDIQQQFGLSYLLISHDLRVIGRMCDCVLVMQQGKIVEQGRLPEVFSRPAHEYTRQLLDAVPQKKAALRDENWGDAPC